MRLLLPLTGDFAPVCADLENQLKAAGDFFRGAQVHLDRNQRPLSPTETETIGLIMAKYGLQLVPEVPPEAPADQPDLARLVRTPLRSGQRVMAEGNILIMGDVHPGAEVLAGGDIIVLGAARGNLAAGLISGREAIVFAFSLRPSLLRLSDLVAQSPAVVPAWSPEVALVKDGEIVVEPFIGWQHLISRRGKG